MIVSTVDPLGGPIMLLGINFDNKLIMANAVHKCATTAAWKTRALLRTRRFYSTLDLVMMYKSHVLSYIEYRTPGIHFACTSVLQDIDDVQKRFLHQIELSEEIAFLEYNLAPLCVRRDIAILGCIHRAAMHQGPPALWKFFRRAEVTRAYNTRQIQSHSLQIAEWTRGRTLEIMRRSAFGMIRVYNLLPQDTVEKADVKSFQSALTQLVRDRLNGGDLEWRFLLSSAPAF